MKTRHRPRFRTPVKVQESIREIAVKHPTWNSRQILDALGSEFEHTPDIRTVQRIVKADRPPDPSGSWRTTEWPGEDVKLVLEVLKYLWEIGEAYQLTQTEAENILWVRQAAPTLPADLAWQLAKRYVLYNVKEIPTLPLDLYLAFRPWESSENQGAYFDAVPEPQRVMYVIEASGTFFVTAPGTE